MRKTFFWAVTIAIFGAAAPGLHAQSTDKGQGSPIRQERSATGDHDGSGRYPGPWSRVHARNDDHTVHDGSGHFGRDWRDRDAQRTAAGETGSPGADLSARVTYLE